MTDSPAPIRRIGIISGVREELEAFLPEQPRALSDEGSLRVERLAWQGKDLFATCAGVGKVAAAVAATVLYTRFSVQLLLVIGTAGKIGEIEGELFNITEAVQSDFGAKRPAGVIHYPAGTLPMGPSGIQPFRAFAAGMLDLPNARIASSDLFVECGIHAQGIFETLASPLVDMETAAVAHAASLLHVPWIAIKATTDDAGETSASSFAENLAAAARASARAAERLVAML